MQESATRTTPIKLWLLLLPLLLLIITAIVTVQQFQAASGELAVSATYARGILDLTIPYLAAQGGAGKLSMEVLDPEDHVLGRAENAVHAVEGKGHWRERIALTKPLPIDELVWQRVRYRFEYSDGKSVTIEGTESISQILRTPVVHILGQQSYLTGGEAAVRVIVTDSQDEIVNGRGSVRIELLVPDQKSNLLFSGPLDRRGTTEAQFRFPAGLVGGYQLRYLVDTPIGSTEFMQAVRLEDKVSILLTTEKPIYQPGQTIHVRALALDRASHEAAAGRKLTFEVEDSRGNKVFKNATQTDKFGIASAEFGLADEVNLGTYHLRALMGDSESPTNTAEIALNVERYVLPKFKVAVDFSASDHKTKRGYRPGDHVTGTVHANYFFGKPVDDGTITVKASTMDVSLTELGSVQGSTDHDGNYHFDLTLPTYFVGRPLTQGAARVLIEATVKDSADHSETRGEPITVSESPLLITAVPEGGTLIPNLENQVFILASYPDGTPASASLKVHSEGQTDQPVTTDEGGVAVIRVNPGSGTETLEIAGKDQEGNYASITVLLQPREGEDQILLRTERAVYKAGDRIALRVFSTKKRGAAYLDVVKDGQTVLTRDLDIENGQAELSLTATPELAGTVDFNAYLFGRDARPVGDHRLVFVQPADELKIDAVADAPVYKPGGEARVRFRVTNSHGEGVSAALGLQVVDEAVFALAEKQPGFAKVFFYLEQEVMKPRYEIHSIGMPEIVEPVEESKAEQRDRAARALFSATEMVNTNKFETEFGRTVPMAKYQEYAGRYQARFLAQVRRLAENLSAAYRENPEKGDLTKVFARISKAGGPDLLDAWGTELRVEPVPWYRDKTHYMVRSAGVDQQFDSGDDMAAYIEVRTGNIVGRPNSGTIELNIEHDRGPFNGFAEIAGTVADPSGAMVRGASVQVREVSSGKTRTVNANDSGQFNLAGLPSGKYEVQVSQGGFEIASREITVQPRDRAVLSVSLAIGASTQVVEVTGAAPRALRMAGAGVVGGVPGGVAGGVMGGVIANGRMQALEMAPMDASPARIPRAIAQNSAILTKDKKEEASSSAHVRSYFPEALYINPEIITDQNGVASITIPLADSITTWRMAMLASTTHGALGSATSSLKVFQDFFVDLDLPVTLTQGDRVSIPVAVYNYSGARGDVSLKLQPDDWFSLVDDVSDKSVTVDSARVGGSQFTLEARRIGRFKLTLSARMNGGADRADIVVREIEVIPNGREQNLVFNGRLENSVQHELNFPANSIPDASKIFVRLYPGPLSQVIEGMDSILRMPGGCFEQTSSSTYPDVLALDYMKRTKKLTPEVHAKAEGYIANGYQRLLTFEVPGGGFSWFGQAPANKILTAYGLMEFSDMSKVYDVDPRLISRTQQWLASQQQAYGSWKPDTQFINEGATNRYNSDVLRITAYIAWSLENTGYQGEAVEKAKQFIESHMSAKIDTYTLAVIANFAVDSGDRASDDHASSNHEKDRGLTRQAIQLLLDARTEKDEQAWWSADETGVYATGASATVETTGLAVQALLKWGEASGTARKAMSYLASKKDAAGTWGTTQATIMALRALLLATEKGAADVRGTLEVLLNGKPVEKLTLTPENNDLLHQFVFKGIGSKEMGSKNIESKNVESKGIESKIMESKIMESNGAGSQGSNTVEIRFEGKGGLAYQVVGSYFLPWDEKPAHEPLSIDVAYDRTHLAQDDIAAATATIKNNLQKSANMVMVDLGIPPGFDLLSEDLQTFVEKTASQKTNRLEKFSLTATQAILYFNSIAPGDTVTLHFRLRAKYPIRAKTFRSRVYEYYDPDVSSVARPVQLEVRQR
jgi:A-macroglobulin TED domain/Alpha-2-macroglobulin family/Carboxypeptidase regulatory-like domain/MG2 domain/A-macroglobulin receptor binding domain/Alpha-2-macroglobulin bait region domain/Macroglobulin domain MG3